MKALKKKKNEVRHLLPELLTGWHEMACVEFTRIKPHQNGGQVATGCVVISEVVGGIFKAALVQRFQGMTRGIEIFINAELVIPGVAAV